MQSCLKNGAPSVDIPSSRSILLASAVGTPLGFLSAQACFQERCATPSHSFAIRNREEKETGTASRDENI